jgi:hypothetical protein
MKRHLATSPALGFILSLAVTATQAQNELDPRATEELLDLVMVQCRAGQAEAARQIAQDILEQLPTTPAIQALLNPVLSGACQAPAPSHLTELHLSLGWDDNVNLGISIGSINFQTANQTFNYQLDDSYRPISSAYISATGMRQHTTDSGWTVQALAGARQMSSYSPLDTLGLQVTGRRPLQVRGAAGHLTIGWAETWLGGQHYRSSPSLSWQSLPSKGRQGWSLQTNIQQHQHHTLSTADARLLQGAIAYQTRLWQNTQISWGAGLLHDQALGQRAGGNRQGHHLQARWQRLTPAGLWHVQWAKHQWQSSNAFLPGLLDQQRRNNSDLWAIGFQRPLQHGSFVYVEYLHRNNRDSVPLYTHQSNQISAGWLVRWP